MTPRGLAAYGERNRVLRRMGYDSYAAYLASDVWASIRRRVLTRNRYCVSGCGRKAAQVHHERYAPSDMDGSDLRKLHAVCDECHRRCEYRDSDGAKLDPVQATAKLFSLYPKPPTTKPKTKKKPKPAKRAGQAASSHELRMAEETYSDYLLRREQWVHPRLRGRKKKKKK